ncbi:MAG: hypothetical protein ACNYZG_01150, partial [Gammaproteobacteria bacterium]
MTTTINLATTETLNSAKTGILSKAKAGTEGLSGLNTEDSLDSEDSFLASMLKLSDDTVVTDENLDLSADGNILPISGNLTENAAENDPPLLLASLNLQNINNQQVTPPVTHAAEPVVLDNDILDSSMKMSSE